MDHLENLKELQTDELVEIAGGSEIGYWLGYALGYLGKGLRMPGAVNIAMDLMNK
jgi:hypothetical protein